MFEYVNGGSYAQEVLESLASKIPGLRQVMYRRSSLELQLYFFALMLLEECMQKKLVTTLHNYDICMREA